MHRGKATFSQLLSLTQLSPGTLFLGLLLGQDNWSMSQTAFYGEVWAVLK
jgi:hypothetical protein